MSAAFWTEEVFKSMSVEDLMCVLRHHYWVYDQEIYICNRAAKILDILYRLLLLLSALPVSRPGAIIQSGCAKGNNRALQYRGMELVLISNPRTERTVEAPRRDICLSSPLSLILRIKKERIWIGS